MTAKKPTPSKAASPAAKAAKPAAVEPKKKAAPAGEGRRSRRPRARARPRPRASAAKKGKGDDKAAKPEAPTSTCPTSRPISRASRVAVEAEASRQGQAAAHEGRRAKERALMREFGLDETRSPKKRSPSAARS